MAFLTTAVAVIGAGLLINLTLTFVLVRRMRQHGEQHASDPAFGRFTAFVPVGTKVPAFTVRTISGETRTLADLSGASSLVAFMSPGCPQCKKQLPAFREFAQAVPGGAAQVLVIIRSVAGNQAAPYLVRELDGLASVAFESGDGPAHRALSIKVFPSFYTLDAAGRVLTAGPVVPAAASPELV